MVGDIHNCYESAFWIHITEMSQRQIIAGKVKSSRHFVQNVLRDYDLNIHRCIYREQLHHDQKLEDVVEFLENEKLCKPSISSTELQQRLLLNGIVHHVDLSRPWNHCVFGYM